jgi:hypothetical protein
MAWHPATPERWATATEVASQLGIAPYQAKQLQQTRVLGGAIALDESRVRLATPMTQLTQISSRPLLSPDDPELPAAVIAKVTGPQEVDEAGRKWTGWALDMPEAIQEAATSRWWPLPPVEPGTLLVVAVATVIVRVREIVGTDERIQGRTALRTAPAGPNPYDNARVKTRPGPVVDLVNLMSRTS